MLYLKMIAILVLAAACVGQPALAQTDVSEEVLFNRRNLGGPRFGVTVIPGSGTLADELENQDMGRVISQFGWHFERQVIPQGGGPQFVVEFVPLLAGVEYGKFIPNLTLAMGVRTPGGIEFGMGPNVFFSKTLDDQVEARSSLLMAVGKSINYGGVSIPVNIAYTTNPDGNRVSLVVGYAIGSARKKSQAPSEADLEKYGLNDQDVR
jgi:hypothetical protein